MKSRSIGGVAVAAVPAAAVAVAGGVAGGAYADDADVAVAADGIVGGGEIDAVGDAWGAGVDLCVLVDALSADLGGAMGGGSTYAGLADSAVMEAGAIGGSSDRSWKESSGSGMSSSAATESVGAIGAGAGASSDWNEVGGVDDAAGDGSSADGSRRVSEPVLLGDVAAAFAQRPEVDAVPEAVGAAEGATLAGAADADAADVSAPDVNAADVGDADV